MSNIKSRGIIFKNIISCCIIVCFFLFISTFIYFLFDVEKLSPGDEAHLKSQMDNVLFEYKNTMSAFEKQEENTKIVTLYAIDISLDDPNKEIQYVGGTYSIDISSDICLDISEGLWIDNGEIKHVNNFNCGKIDYIQKKRSVSDIENWAFTEEGFLDVALQKFYCDYYDIEYNFKDEILSLKNKLIDNYNKEVSDNSNEKIYVQVKKEINAPFLHTIKISMQAVDETNSLFNLSIHFYRNY